MITANMSLAEVVKQYPQTIPYLNGLHLDYCCNGHLPIKTVLDGGSVDLEAFLREINECAERGRPETKDGFASIESFKALSIGEMLSDLETTHHVAERDWMAQAEALLNKILIVHYPHHGAFLSKLHRHFALMKAELEEHFAKEERLVFPLMRAKPKPDQATLASIAELEQEHALVGDMLKELQELTEDFRLPEDACPTYAETYRVLKALMEDIFVHVFKENSILFPEYEEQGQKS